MIQSRIDSAGSFSAGAWVGHVAAPACKIDVTDSRCTLINSNSDRIGQGEPQAVCNGIYVN